MGSVGTGFGGSWVFIIFLILILLIGGFDN